MQLCNDGEISLSVVLIITTIKRYDWGSGGVFCNVVLVTKYLHLLCIQTDSGTYLASQPMDTWHSLPRAKADKLPPSSAKVKNAHSYTFTSKYMFTAWS